MNRLFYMTIDTRSIIQSLKKQLLSLIFISIISGICIYMLYDTFVQDKYSADITFTAINDNTGVMVNNYSVNAARNRIITYILSDAVQTSLCEIMGDDLEELPGEIEAIGLTDSNMIQVKCTANSPEKVLKMERVIRKNVPILIEKMSETFKVTALGYDYAEKIEKTSPSALKVSVILALMIFFAGVFFVTISQIFNGKIKNREQAEKVLDMEIVGTIPHEHKKKEKQSMLVSSSLRTLDYVEAFQHLALSVIRTLKKKDQKVIVITSMLENEGKSTVAANLALSLSKNNKKILLIDADLRKPALHKIFEESNEQSFVDYLHDENKKIHMKEVQPNVYCCFAKNISGNADEILEKESFKNFLNSVKEDMDFVIIDTPPAVGTRDALVISKYADTTFVVTRTNMVPISLINEEIEEFEMDGIDVLGAIINDCFEIEAHTDRYGYKYNYNYNYR